VLLGLEADYAEGHEAALEEILRVHDWDVVLGSVHWVAGGWIDAPGGPSRVPCYKPVPRYPIDLLAPPPGTGTHRETTRLCREG
jgi:hypothetical protein